MSGYVWEVSWIRRESYWHSCGAWRGSVGPAKGLGRLLRLLFTLALSSKGVRTGAAGELRLKEGVTGQRHPCLCNIFVWEGDCLTSVISRAYIFCEILPL